MKFVIALPALLAALSLAAGAHAQSGHQSTTPAPPSQGTGKVGSKASGAGIPSQGAERDPSASDDPTERLDPPSAGVREPGNLDAVDREFMRQAAHNGLAEVEASELAQRKATRGDVKAFAGKMIDDHTKANEELQRLAASKNLALPVQPSMPQRSAMNTLRSVEGEDFDRAYAEHFGLRAHEAAIRLFENAAAKARNAQVRAYARAQLPALKEHLSMAKALRAALEPPAPGRRQSSQDGTASTNRSSAVDASATPQGDRPGR